MKIYVKKVEGVTLPRKGTELSAGYDIIATSDPKIVGVPLGLVWLRVDYIEYETSLFISPSAVSFHTLIHPRSSVSKYNLVLANSIGLIDNDYRGMVICRFKYQWQPEDMWMNANGHSLVGKVNMDKIYKKGDAIAQLVVEPTVQVEWEFVDDLTKTVRGEGGFGSTDAVKITSGPASNMDTLIPITKNHTDSIVTMKHGVTQDPVKDHKTSSSPLLEKYRGSPVEIPKPTSNYETFIKEREKQMP